MRRVRTKRRSRTGGKRIYFWLMTVGLTALIFLTANQRHRLNPLENALGTVVMPFQRAITSVMETANRAGDRLFGTPALRREFEALQAENEALRQYNRNLQEVVAKEEYLKNEYALLTETDYRLLPAVVTGKESGGLFIRFTIDKGAGDGVSEGDLVVLGTEQDDETVIAALVGRIVSVGENLSQVTGILDDTTNLSFKNVRTQHFGVLNGRTSTGLSGYFFDTDADVLTGDAIVTSGLTPTYPEGLYIGEVVSFETAEHDRMKHIMVETGVDFTKLYRVMVLQHGEAQ